MRITRALTAGACLALAVGVLGASVTGAAADDGRQLVSTDPADFTPNVDDGEVVAIAQIGDTVIVGGTFTSVSQHQVPYPRTGLAAFDAGNGQVRTTFAPQLDGEVTAISPAYGATVYVAGRFRTVNGERHPKLVKLDVQTGAVIEEFEAPPINGQIKDVTLALGQVLIAGAFTSVDGQPRGGVASLTPRTGALTTRLATTFTGVNNGGRTNVAKIAVTADASRLVAIGNFTEADGLARRQVAQLSLTDGAYVVADWSTQRFGDVCSRKFNSYVRDVAYSPDGSYFVIANTGGYHGGGTLCDSVSRWETQRAGGRQQPTWVDHTGGDTLDSVAVTDAAVYVGGHMRWLNNPFGRAEAGPGAVPHEGIAALDPATGLPFSWTVSKQRGIGVFDLLATADGLWIGSDTEWIQGERRARIAYLPLTGGELLPGTTVPGLPGRVAQLGRPGDNRRADQVRFTGLDQDGHVGRTTGLTTKVRFRNARGAFAVGSTTYTPWSDGRLLARAVTARGFGTTREVPLYGGRFADDAPDISGIVYDPATSRLIYTISGRDRLYWRWFTPESGVVGAARYVTSPAELPADEVTGMFLADGWLYYSRLEDRALYRVPFDSGVTGAPGVGVSGPPELVDDSRRWRAQGLTVLP